MTKSPLAAVLASVVLVSGVAYQSARATVQDLASTRIAVTVDDLPASGDLLPGTTRLGIARGLLRALKNNSVPQAYGFANGALIDIEPALVDVMKEWLKNGYPVGNHGYQHINIGDVTTQAYIADIDKMDRLLRTLAPVSPLVDRRRVYRYPFLEEGDTRDKRETVRWYLFSNGYRIAQVTIDYYDWAWGAAYTRCLTQHNGESIARLKIDVVDAANRAARASRAVARLLFGRDIPQILLVHSNIFNTVTLEEILKTFRAQGATLISLDEALEDSVYQIDPRLPFDTGRTFLEQVAASRNVDVGSLDESPYTLAWLAGICAAPDAK